MHASPSLFLCLSHPVHYACLPLCTSTSTMPTSHKFLSLPPHRSHPPTLPPHERRFEREDGSAQELLECELKLGPILDKLAEQGPKRKAGKAQATGPAKGTARGKAGGGEKGKERGGRVEGAGKGAEGGKRRGEGDEERGGKKARVGEAGEGGDAAGAGGVEGSWGGEEERRAPGGHTEQERQAINLMRDQSTVFVKNIPLQVSEAEVTSMFSG